MRNFNFEFHSSSSRRVGSNSPSLLSGVSVWLSVLLPLSDATECRSLSSPCKFKFTLLMRNTLRQLVQHSVALVV